ncbi:LuxR C-terminal-related transcriptional regulator [Bradyrhizobium sp. TZ2]
MPSILLIDEHGVYRKGIRALIEDADLARVVEGVELRGELGDFFDLLLIDFNSLDQLRLQEARARTPRMRLAVMSTSNARSDVLSCLAAGFHGYLHKTQTDAEWLRAITDLLSGRISVPRWLAEQDDAEAVSTVSLELESLRLTGRQRQVLPLLARGMSTKEIALELNIAAGTAKIHIAALLRVLGARNRTQAAFVAAKVLRSKASNNEEKALIRLPQSPSAPWDSAERSTILPNKKI